MSLLARRRLLSITLRADTFEIISDSSYTGKYFYCTCEYNNSQVAGNWSLTSGSNYATINSNGRVDINEGVTNQQITVTCTYGNNTASKTITISYDNQLVIECSDTMTGTSGNAIARYNSTVVSPTWSITSGGSYATINSSGAITITSSGTITIQAVYSGYTATKTVAVVYEANTETNTTVNEDGSVTTETTTTTTDPQTGAVTEQTTSQTVNEDGSTSSTSTQTTTNTDGSSSTTSTTTNLDGSGSTTQSQTSAPDASGTTTTQTNISNYDEYGNTTGSTVINAENHSDNSSATTTVNYDENGDPTDGTNNTIDTSGNSNTQSVEYNDQGQPVVNGYTIDTSGNPSGNGETIPAGGVDTGLIPFDGRGFRIHVKFKLNMSNNQNKVLIAALQPSGTNKRYSGFCIYAPQTSAVATYGGTNTQIRNNYFGSMVTGGYGDKSATSGISYLRYCKSGDIEYTLDITYDPAKHAAYLDNYLYSFTLQPIYSSTTSSTKYGEARSTIVSNSSYLPTSLEEATITIGSYDMPDGTGHDAVNLRVLEFNVEKLT